jgi:hypothetical protein
MDHNADMKADNLAAQGRGKALFLMKPLLIGENLAPSRKTD